MARGVASRREGETEEERATRLAAAEVLVRLQQARHREVEEAYWRSRGGATSASRKDADSMKNVHRHGATPRATLSGVVNTPHFAHNTSVRGDGDAGVPNDDLEVDALARAASRVGATPDVSRRVANEILAAERAAVALVMRAASTRRVRSSARARINSSHAPRTGPIPSSRNLHDSSVQPRRRVAFETPLPESSFDGWHAREDARGTDDGERNRESPGESPERDRDDEKNDNQTFSEDDDTAHASSALWGMAHTPTRKNGRRPTPNGNAVGDSADTQIHSIASWPPVMDASAAAAVARGSFRDNGRQLSVALSEAAAAAVEDGLRKLVSKTNKELKNQSPVAMKQSRGSSLQVHGAKDVTGSHTHGKTNETTSNNSGASDTSNTDDTAWLSEEAFGGAEGEFIEDKTGNEININSSSSRAWSSEDAAAVRAAHAAVRRAEEAALSVTEEERVARVNTTNAVARLLDARVLLAAATARLVSEEAAFSAAATASAAASLRLTLDDEVGDGGNGVGACEALAGALSVPLPRVNKLLEKTKQKVVE